MFSSAERSLNRESECSAHPAKTAAVVFDSRVQASLIKQYGILRPAKSQSVSDAATVCKGGVRLVKSVKFENRAGG